jgi:hypothetical protein
MTAAVEFEQASASPHAVGGAQAAAHQPDSFLSVDPRDAVRRPQLRSGVRIRLHKEEVG